jgi:hypothetical protein
MVGPVHPTQQRRQTSEGRKRGRLRQFVENPSFFLSVFLHFCFSFDTEFEGGRFLTLTLSQIFAVGSPFAPMKGLIVNEPY